MRDAFVDTLTILAVDDRSIILVTADLGFGIFDKFRDLCPNQFHNVGISEQNLVGVSVGLASIGFKPVIYSIAPFVTLRCFEQLRNGIGYHNSNVVVVGSGGGFTYGSLGFSHHSLEDIALMRSIPSMTVCTPSCNDETKLCLEYLLNQNAPAYLRLEKNNFYSSKISEEFIFGKSRKLSSGSKCAIFSYGGIVENIYSTLKDNDLLGSCSVYSFHCLTNIDQVPLRAILESETPLITIEEHRVSGGLFAACNEVFISLGKFPKRYKALCVPDINISIVGDQEFLRNFCNLGSKDIIDAIREFEITSPHT